MMTYSHPTKSGCKKGLAVQNDIAEAVVFWLQKMTHPYELELCCLDLEDTLQKMTHPCELQLCCLDLDLENTLQKMTHPCELELCVALTLKILYKRWPIPVS